MASVTVTAALTSYAANNKMAAVTIADTSANIATNLNALLPLVTANKITSITQTGTASALAITATQLTADATVLAKITGTYTLAVSGVTAGGTATVVANTHVTSLAVTDSAANMTTNLTALIALGTKLTGITESGTVTAIALTAAQYTTAFTAKFTNFTAVVTGVSVANAVTVAADSHVSSISVIGANTTDLDSATLGNLSNVTSIALANGVTSLSYIEYVNANSKLVTSGLTITNVPVANASLVAADSHVSSISVIGANTTDLDSATLGNLANVTSIALASGATSLTYAEYHNANSKLISTGLTITGVSVANAATLNADNHVSSITVTGVTAANLDTNSLGNLSKVTSIALASGVTNLSYTEYVDANGKLVTNGLTTTGVSIANSSDVLTDTKVSGLSISDNAANISANLDVLETEVGKISGITVSDSTIVTITPAQKTSDAAILALITVGGGSYKVVGSIPTSGTVDIFLAYEASLGASSFTINDTATNITTHLNEIENGINSIAAINLTDITPPSIVLTAQQFLADQDVLVTMAANQTIGHPAYILSLALGETLTAQQAASINQTIFENFIANSVVVKDSAANIELYANALQNLTIDPPLGVIQLTDTSAVNLSLNAINYGLVGIIKSDYSFSLDLVVNVSDISTLLNPFILSNVNLFDVIDNASNIIKNWGNLLTLYAENKLGTISVSDGGDISLNNAGQVNVNSQDTLSVLSKITGISSITVPLDSMGFSSMAQASSMLDSLNFKVPLTLGINLTTNSTSVIYGDINNILSLQSLLNKHPDWNIVVDQTVDFSPYVTINQWGGSYTLADLEKITNTKILNYWVNNYYHDGQIIETPTVTSYLTFLGSAFAQTLWTKSILPYGAFTSINIVDSAEQLQLNLSQLAVYSAQIIPSQLAQTTFTITDQYLQTFKINASDFTNDCLVLNSVVSGGVIGNYLLSISGAASELNSLNLAATNAKFIELTPTVLDSNFTVIGAVTDINLTHLSLSSSAIIATHQINNGLGTEIDITDGSSNYVISLENTMFNDLAVFSPLTLNPLDSLGIVLNPVITSNDLFNNLSNYESLFILNKLGGIVLTDSSNFNLVFSALQPIDYIHYYGVLNLVEHSTNINNLINSYNHGSIVSPLFVTDTSNQILNNLPILKLINSFNDISGIFITDAVLSTNILTVGSSAELAASYAQMLVTNGINQFDAGNSVNILDTLGLQDILQSGVSFTSDSTAVNAQINSADFSFFTNANLTALNAAGVGSIGVNLGNSASIQTLDGISGHLNFEFAQNTTGTPSETHFDSILNFSGKDEISFTSLLQVVGNTGSASDGLASINATTGIANFSANDNTLALQLAAVENAIASANTPAAGHVVVWANGGNTEVLITDSHSGSVIGAGDNLIQLVGVSPDHVALLNGVIVAV